MHQQQWLAVLEELPAEQALNAPGDFESTGADAENAYAFFDHLADRDVDRTARFASGPSLDGKGEFTATKPPRPPADTPALQPAPAAAHAGAEATGDVGNVFGRLTGRVKQAVDQATPG